MDEDKPAEIPVIILAGGNLVELQGKIQPKGCLRVMGQTLLQRTIRHYWKYGHRKFLVCTGSGHEKILAEADICRCSILGQGRGEGQVQVKFTGESAGTAERIGSALLDLRNHPIVAITYVDIVSNVDVREVLAVHLEEKAAVTLTAVHLPTRFKSLGAAPFSPRVLGFATKPITENTLVCGGYYFLNLGQAQECGLFGQEQKSFENDSLPPLAVSRKVAYYKHEGFWQCVDSSRDIRICEETIGLLSPDLMS